MPLQVECPRCPTVLEELDGRWVCPVHGETAPLLCSESPDYHALTEHLDNAGGMPTWAPWPMPLGWSVSDFGAVRPDAAHASATYLTCGGMTNSDGSVLLTAVTEEPGTGLGARAAGVVHDDPGAQTLGRPAQTRVRASGATVQLWLLSTVNEDSDDTAPSQPLEQSDRAVLVGEARGRWLWLVISPASAALGLDAWGDFEDLGHRGPELVDLAFTARPRGW